MHFRVLTTCIASLLLGACASNGGTASQGGTAAGIDALSLYGADGAPHFSFYYSCNGSVAQETQLCSVPSSDFAEWANDHHVTLKRVTKDDFDEKSGLAPAKLSPKDTGLTYRVFVRFVPIAIGSYSWALTGEVKGGYTPPKAGYRIDIFVYNVTDGALLAHSELSSRADAKKDGDPTPFVRDGVVAVLKALAPHVQGGPAH